MANDLIKQLYTTEGAIYPNIGSEISVESLQAAIANKQDKVSGKGLSTNDFTNADKSKLEGISTNAKNVADNHIVTNGTILIDATQTIVYDDSEVRGLIAGKETGYVINALTDITGTETTSGYKNVTAIGTIDLTKIKIGDNAYVKDDNAPDYWVSNLTGEDGVCLTILKTKIDLSIYYTKTETNALLSAKQDTISDYNKLNANYVDIGSGKVLGDIFAPIGSQNLATTTKASYADNDASGNSIESTYATKTEVNSKQNKLSLYFVYNMTDGSGRNYTFSFIGDDNIADLSIENVYAYIKNHRYLPLSGYVEEVGGTANYNLLFISNSGSLAHIQYGTTKTTISINVNNLSASAIEKSSL